MYAVRRRTLSELGEQMLSLAECLVNLGLGREARVTVRVGYGSRGRACTELKKPTPRAPSSWSYSCSDGVDEWRPDSAAARAAATRRGRMRRISDSMTAMNRLLSR